MVRLLKSVTHCWLLKVFFCSEDSGLQRFPQTSSSLSCCTHATSSLRRRIRATTSSLPSLRRKPPSRRRRLTLRRNSVQEDAGRGFNPGEVPQEKDAPLKPASAGCALALPSEDADASAGPQAFPSRLGSGFRGFFASVASVHAVEFFARNVRNRLPSRNALKNAL